MGRLRSIRDVFSQGAIEILQRVGHLVHTGSVHGLCVSLVQDGDMRYKAIPKLFEPVCVLVYGLPV